MTENTSPLEAAAEHRREIFDKLTNPVEGAGDLRSVMVSHIQRLVAEHNAVTQAKIDYIQTGVASDAIRSSLPYIAYLQEAGAWKKKSAVADLERQKLVLPELGSLDDVALVSAYSSALLRLRAILDPDVVM